jgi:hypothetical protein
MEATLVEREIAKRTEFAGKFSFSYSLRPRLIPAFARLQYRGGLKSGLHPAQNVALERRKDVTPEAI